MIKLSQFAYFSLVLREREEKKKIFCTQEPDRLENLQRQAHTIQEILVRLPKSVVSNPESPYQRSISSPQPHEIYQNLPVMGSGLRQPPALPPKEQGKLLKPVVCRKILCLKNASCQIAIAP